MNPQAPELRKVDHPPAAINWVRLNDASPPVIAKRIFRFALSPPRWSYRAANAAAHDRIAFGLDRETARKMALTKGNPLGRPHNLSLVDAFYDYDSQRQYSGRPVYAEGLTEYFKLNQDLWLPVKPLVIVAEDGKLVPVFLCGWSELSLTLFQRRLYMSIVEDAFFSLTDFQQSPGEFLFFPKEGIGKEKHRAPEIWHRGDYDLLTQEQLQEQVTIYLEARDIARLAMIEELKRRAANERDSTRDDRPSKYQEPPNGELF